MHRCLNFYLPKYHFYPPRIDRRIAQYKPFVYVIDSHHTISCAQLAGRVYHFSYFCASIGIHFVQVRFALLTFAWNCRL